MIQPTHHHHNLDSNEENFQRVVAALDGEERKEQLSAEEILAYFPSLADQIIFDGGAGTGFLTLPLAQEAKHVIAFDQSEKMLNLIKERSTAVNLKNIETLAGNITEISLSDEAIDIAVVSLMLHEVHPLEKALEELYRILKKNGQLIILEFEPEEQTAHGGHRVSSKVMREKTEAVGFDIRKQVTPATGLYLIIAEKSI